MKRKTKNINPSDIIYRNIRQQSLTEGAFGQKSILKAIVVEYFSKQKDISVGVTIPRGSVRARIPGIDYDIQDKNLRIFLPQSSHNIERYIKNDMIYIAFENEDNMSSGIILGRVVDDNLHPMGYVDSYQGNYSNDIAYGSNLVYHPITNPVFFYDGNWVSASNIGIAPSIWPIDVQEKKYEYVEDGINIHIDNYISVNVLSAGAGIIQKVEDNKIEINHGIINSVRGEVITIYENIESINEFSNSVVGVSVSTGYPIAKASIPYMTFKMTIGGKYVNPIPYIDFISEESKVNLFELNNKNLYSPEVEWK